MLNTIFILATLIHLGGCTTKKTPKDRLIRGKELYENSFFRKAADELRELDADTKNDNQLETMLYLAKSTLALAQKNPFTKEKNILECIQVCDTIINYNLDYALEHSVHIIKANAYATLCDFGQNEYCTVSGKKCVETIDEYIKISKDKKPEIYQKNRVEVENLRKKCTTWITNRLIKQAMSMSATPKAGLRIIKFIEGDQYSIKSPYLYFNKLKLLISSKDYTAQDLREILKQIKFACSKYKDESQYLTKAVGLVLSTKKLSKKEINLIR